MSQLVEWSFLFFSPNWWTSVFFASLLIIHGNSHMMLMRFWLKDWLFWWVESVTVQLADFSFFILIYDLWKAECKAQCQAFLWRAITYWLLFQESQLCLLPVSCSWSQSSVFRRMRCTWRLSKAKHCDSGENKVSCLSVLLNLKITNDHSYSKVFMLLGSICCFFTFNMIWCEFWSAHFSPFLFICYYIHHWRENTLLFVTIRCQDP